MRVLGIETSCDETAAAVVGPGPSVLSNIVHTQLAAHAPYGGVVPEIASREHVRRIVDIIQQALAEAGPLADIDGIAVTSGPGLVGALLVGLQVAKGLALARGLPWIGVNHLEGHLSAARLDPAFDGRAHVALVVSGGHTQLYAVHAFGDYAHLGGTRDDAAGEAFDKIAKMLGLGYPGGPALEACAQGGDPAAVPLPRALGDLACTFSFSGLKTAVVHYLRQRQGTLSADERRDLCASVQEAIADVLCAKTVAAAKSVGLSGVALAGGVAANGWLRARMAEACRSQGLWCYAPPKALCTDNAAMVAVAGRERLLRGERSAWADSARSRWPLGVRNTP